MIKIKRAYEPRADSDGYRVLIDRLWPRGVSKEEAHVDEWLKEIAPSTELRKWFHADDSRWPEFAAQYRAGLKDHPDELRQLAARAKHHTVTLVYGSHDEEHNHAVLLKEALENL
jgi:uncharacterized protein YeaO (DUF488 family)